MQSTTASLTCWETQKCNAWVLRDVKHRFIPLISYRKTRGKKTQHKAVQAALNLQAVCQRTECRRYADREVRSRDVPSYTRLVAGVMRQPSRPLELQLSNSGQHWGVQMRVTTSMPPTCTLAILLAKLCWRWMMCWLRYPDVNLSWTENQNLICALWTEL